jgi:hypothetical protein
MIQYQIQMKKDFKSSKIEAPQDGSQYVFIGFTDPNEPMSSGGAESPFSKSGEAISFTLQKI